LFAGTILDFIVIAAVVFVLVKAMTITKKKAKEEAPPTPDKKEILLTEIRDLLKK
jgi:large conductance mechanosensitive channel